MTVVETMAAIVVFSIGVLATASMFDRSVSLSNHARRSVESTETTRGAVGPVYDLIAEAKGDSIDTMARYVQTGSSFLYGTDRFNQVGVGLTQCMSPACRFHTKENLELFETAYLCGMNRNIANTSISLRGKCWPGNLTTCPLDGTYTSTNVRTDAIRVITSRAPTGEFERHGTGAPKWKGMSFIVVRATKNGLPELVAFDVHTSDLQPLSGSTYAPSSWTAFDINEASMVDLFDFGTDGSTNGLPDGSVPVTPEKSDAQYEIFLSGTSTTTTTTTTGTTSSQSESILIYEKQLNDWATYPHRYASLRLELGSGRIVFHVRHAITQSMVWEGFGVINREPRVLARNVTEFVASTKDSLPHDPITNPMGVRDSNTVRMVVGTTLEDRSNQGLGYIHRLDHYSVSPRNK
jgi:hypothetical protein